MGEIKSTLDLVMDKTRHLTLSDEEKQEQKEKEFKKNLKGPAQKFQDIKDRFDKLLVVEKARIAG